MDLDLVVKIRRIAGALIAMVLVANVVRNASAQTPDQEQAKEDLHDAEAVCRRHRAELMKIPHVRVVTGEVDGQNEAAILVEVDDQKNIDEVTREVPSQIEGFPVEVDEDDSVESTQGSISAFGTVAADPTASAMPTPFPTIDKNGYYHHSWLPAAKPDAQQ